MKVIDLLNKIVNGESVPKTIKVYGHKYQYANDMRDYKAEDIEKYWLISNFIEDYLDLTEEVEIIEDTPKEDKKLEDRERFQYSQIPLWSDMIDFIRITNENFEKHQKALNEIIDKINGGYNEN